MDALLFQQVEDSGNGVVGENGNGGSNLFSRSKFFRLKKRKGNKLRTQEDLTAPSRRKNLNDPVRM